MPKSNNLNIQCDHRPSLTIRISVRVRPTGEEAGLHFGNTTNRKVTVGVRARQGGRLDCCRALLPIPENKVDPLVEVS